METGKCAELHQGDKQPVWMSSVSFLKKKKKKKNKLRKPTMLCNKMLGK